MKDSTSNQAQNEMEYFKNIQVVDAPDDLYGKVLERISLQKNIVPLTYVRTIAAALILAVLVNVYLGFGVKESSDSQEQLTELVSQTNNQLYE